MWIDILWITIVGSMVIYLSITFYIANEQVHPKRVSLLEAHNREKEKDATLLESYLSWNIEKERLQVDADTTLQIYDITPKENTLKFCVIAHGYTYTHHGAIKYADVLMKLGYHVVLFDQRYHGASTGKGCTLGIVEQHDLRKVIDYVYEKYPYDLFLGTVGESMGGATALLEQTHDDRVRFVWSDCSFSDLTMLTKYLISRKTHLPSGIFMPGVRLWYQILTKHKMEEANIAKAASNAKIPIFIGHGMNDEFIPMQHALRLFDQIPTHKKLFLAQNEARHAEAIRKDKERYHQAIQEFIESIR